VGVIGGGGTIFALSTTMPQLMHNLFTFGPLLLSTVALALAVYVAFRISKDFPGKALIERLRADVAGLEGEHADLVERFSRFQKREGMRHARSAREREQDILAEAQQLAAQGGSQEPADQGKLALYRRGINH